MQQEYKVIIIAHTLQMGKLKPRDISNLFEVLQ